MLLQANCMHDVHVCVLLPIAVGQLQYMKLAHLPTPPTLSPPLPRAHGSKAGCMHWIHSCEDIQSIQTWLICGLNL